MAANATIEINGSAVYTKAAALATYTGSPKLSETLILDTSNITKVYETSGTITVATTIDVTGLTDVYGASISFANVKGLVISNTHATATLTIGGGTTPLYGTDQYTLKAGHALAITSTFAVSTNINFKITPSASCTYKLLIVGN